jgi:prepilin-type N-terminal cleavage/methylation domain-containing protein
VKNKKKLGFTLIELILSVSILASLMILLIGVLSPKLLIDKANDSVKKKDLNKIRTAFEEYFNDKGRYPSFDEVSIWNVETNCGETIIEMANYLNKWPCDPDGKVYSIMVDDNWFKVVTNLGNEKDKDIPDGWYEDVSRTRYTAVFDRETVNYGVSSSNVLWYEGDGVSSDCGRICLKLNASGCNDAAGIGCSAPDNCYWGTCSLEVCRTSSCN